MLKKLVSLILSFIIVFSLTGCNLFVANDQRRSMQIVATINSVTETEGGKTFTSEPKSIYRYQLINELNNNTNYQSMDIETATNQALQSLIIAELIILDVDRMIEFGEMDWRDGSKLYYDGTAYENADDAPDSLKVRDYTDVNVVNRLIYSAIDSTIKSIREEILTGRGDELPIFTATEETTETTYPIREEKTDDDIVVRESTNFVEELQTDKTRWPGYYGSVDDKSLSREAMRRFVSLLQERAKEDYTIDAKYALNKADKQRAKEQHEKFALDDEKIEQVINEKGIEYVYPMLHETSYVEYFIGRNALRQAKYAKIQEHLGKNVTVADSEVYSAYNQKLSAQASSYADMNNYVTAVKDGTTTVLYHPSSKYFYVKHILLPFSDSQKAELNNFKSQLFKSNDVAAKTKIEQFRNNMVNSIVVYPHLNGEDDKTRPTNVATVFHQIKSAMAAASAVSARDAERVFDDFIYLYNTDPGMFSSQKGYVVEHTLGAGESETYMQEFADLAREMYWNQNVGEIAPNYCVTDYGVHIMYLASKTYGTVNNPEIYGTNSFVTPAGYETYFDILNQEVEQKRTEEAFAEWQNSRILYYEKVKQIFDKFEKAYKDIYEG